jgi:hypothetical protein
LRIKEQESGYYDFKTLKASLLSKSSRVDVANFTSNITIAPSPGRGRGLFATRDLHTGDVILAEKSFCVVFGEEGGALSAMTYDLRDDRVRVFPAGLCRAVVQKLLDNPSQVAKVMDLYGDYRCPEIEKKGGGDGEGEEVVDVFQVHDIVARNAFGPGPAPSLAYCRHQDGSQNSTASAGLWVMASYTNHSCVPNAEKEYIGDLMILRATREIREGEEVVQSYVQVDSDFEGRSKALGDTWGFKCECKLCVAERGDSEDVRRKRRGLEAEAEGLMEGLVSKGGSRVAVVRARRLAKEIEGTYEGERWNGVPRVALMRIEKWIAEATSR